MQISPLFCCGETQPKSDRSAGTRGVLASERASRDGSRFAGSGGDHVIAVQNMHRLMSKRPPHFRRCNGKR
jgi:hypothetical protein